MNLRHLYVCYRRVCRQTKKSKIRVVNLGRKGSYRRIRGTKLVKLKVTNKKRVKKKEERNSLACLTSALFKGTFWQERSPVIIIFFCFLVLP